MLIPVSSDTLHARSICPSFDFCVMALLLPRSLFLHIPKTGGSWVREAVRRAGILTDEISPAPTGTTMRAAALLHAAPGTLHIQDRFRFAFVRNPLSFYQSYWCFRMLHGWDPRLDIDRTCHSDDFETFVRGVLTEVPGGWVTRVYARFLGANFSMLDFVGRTENLAEDLFLALSLAGETFDAEAIRATPEQNVSSRLSEWADRCRYSPKLRAFVCFAERLVMDHFGYGENEEEVPQAAGMMMSKHTQSIT